MKRMLAIALAALLVFGLTACGGTIEKADTLDREFLPDMADGERRRRIGEWSKAVECAKAWSRICGSKSER